MAITRTQLFTVATKGDGSGSTVSNILASIPVAGNLLVACLSNGDGGGAISISSFADNVGDGVSWTEATINPQGLTSGSNTQYRMYYKVVGTPSGGLKTVTVTIAGTQALQLFVGEYGSDSGAVTWSVTGSQITARAASGLADAGDITTAIADSVLVGFLGHADAQGSAGTSFTRQVISGNWAADAVEDRLITSTGTYAVDWGSNGAGDTGAWVALGIAFGAAPVGGGPTVSTVSSNSATEGSAIVHTVTLSGATSGTTNFAATLVGVTATGSGTDFTSALGSATYSNGVTFSGGNMVVPTAVTSWTVSVPTTTDALDEDNETYTLTVGGVAGTGTITDDDALPSLSVADATQSGANVTFTVTMTPASGRSVTVAFATANGSKTAGTHYTANSGTLTFAPGETTKTVVVAAI